MHRLGGKVIPNSNPPVRFKLNHNSTRLQQGEPDTSIWVGDLSPDVDDYALYQFFAHRFQTVRCAKVRHAYVQKTYYVFRLCSVVENPSNIKTLRVHHCTEA
jgi:RNA recognition motif-containing protein